MDNNALQQQVSALQTQLNQLSGEYYRNNFGAYQDFSKYSAFTGRLRVPVVTALSTTCEIGELCSYAGKLYHASALNTWTAQT
jgi:hypothetical protein